MIYRKQPGWATKDDTLILIHDNQILKSFGLDILHHSLYSPGIIGERARIEALHQFRGNLKMAERMICRKK